MLSSQHHGKVSQHEEEDGEEVIIQEHHNCFTRQSPSWWVVRLSGVLTLALLVNVALIVLLATLASSSNSETPSAPQQRISSNLNNATIPNWKPLPPSSTIITRVAFGSCNSQEMPQPVWDTVLSSSTPPDLFLLMGDNVYGDCETDDCFLLRDAYRKWSQHPSLQGAAPHLSVFATLDDHDYGLADCHVDNPHKHVARSLFAEFFDIPDSQLPVDGVYRAQVWGPPGQRLQVILLDTRYNRSPFHETGDPSAPYRPKDENDPDQHMLSEIEWSWLEAQLEVPAELRIVVSSVQVLNNVTGFEAWRHLPAERDRLQSLLQAKRVILLSGDRHVGGFYESNGLVEVTASSFTHTLPFGAFCNGTTAAECDEVDPTRVGDFIRQNHFGTAEIDWVNETVILELRRTESTYGSTYFQTFDKPGKFSDAGSVLASRVYSIADL